MTEQDQKLVQTLERVAAKYVECVGGGVRFGFVPQSVLDAAQADAAVLLAHVKALREAQ